MGPNPNDDGKKRQKIDGDNDSGDGVPLSILMRKRQQIGNTSWITRYPDKSYCEKVRASTAWVTEQAKHVSISDQAVQRAIEALTEEEVADFYSIKGFDRDLHFYDVENPDLVAQYLLVVDSLNFCFWPRDSLEYEHISGGLKAAMLSQGTQIIDANHLASITEEGLNSFLHGAPENIRKHGFPQVGERVRLLREVGQGLLFGYDGQASNLIRAASGSAIQLVQLVTEIFPGFQDHAVYQGSQVFFYKRAQIFVGDLYGAFQGQGLGAFDDIDQITMFADYRVPAVLRELGILQYKKALESKIDEKGELPAGGNEEVEIRAATVTSVERLKAGIHKRAQELQLGHEKPPLSLAIDWYLWEQGEKKRFEHRPHHRTLTVFY